MSLVFATAAPPLPDNVVTANSTVKVEQIKVYGLGVFINDLAAMDLVSAIHVLALHAEPPRPAPPPPPPH